MAGIDELAEGMNAVRVASSISWESELVRLEKCNKKVWISNIVAIVDTLHRKGKSGIGLFLLLDKKFLKKFLRSDIIKNCKGCQSIQIIFNKGETDYGF